MVVLFLSHDRKLDVVNSNYDDDLYYSGCCVP